ncbi:MAG: glycerol kinase GlpK [Clostridiales bacterium]|nr:glycerol kinase GlpK [Clostridiales bacterium]
MDEYILAVDQGTTSTKAFALGKDGTLIKSHPVNITQHYPAPGFVEHDAKEIYVSVLKTMADILIWNPIIKIDGLAITNQRETTIAFNKDTGEPYCNAIVWQCRRTADICRREEFTSVESEISHTTGLKLDPYFSATKMRWILENAPGTEKAALSGELRFGTVDGYLVYMLTGKKNFYSDYSNCSRTMLFDINKLEYSDRLLQLFDIPRTALAEPKPSCFDYGQINLDPSELAALGLSDDEINALKKLNGVHINAVAGDQAAALFGQTCFEKGTAKTTYGTGCFTLMNIGQEPQFSDNGLLTSAAWSYKGETTYALEGSVFQGGSVITWLKEGLQIIDDPSECDSICRSIPDNGGVYLVPAFSGMGAPYWDPDLRGTITGLTGGTGRAHVVRASVESIAYQVTELVDLMMKDTGITSTHMKVDGGVCACEFLMQLQADLLGITITRARSDEMTATGVGMMAGLTSGFFESFEELSALYRANRVYNPGRSSKESNELLNEYRKAVKASIVVSGRKTGE